MVAIRNSDANRFIAKPPAHIFIYLIFGNDPGLISERKTGLLQQLLADPKDPFQAINLSGDQISADPLALLDEAHSVSMFGGRKAICVDIGLKSIIGALEPLFGTPPIDCFIVLIAGALKRDSALRVLLEREKHAATIECAPDSASDIRELIAAATSANRISIDADAMAYLASLLGADRLSTRAELDKLLLYCHGQSSIELKDVENSVADAAMLVMDSVIDGAFSGDLETADAAASRAMSMGADVNTLLIFALRKALGLHGSQTGGGNSWQRQDGGSNRQGQPDLQLKLWTTAKLLEAVAIISEAIAKIRREPALSAVIATRCLWSISRLARRRL